MLKKNIRIYFLRKFEHMRISFTFSGLIVNVGFALLIMTSACQKTIPDAITPGNDTTYNAQLFQLFSINVLNRDFTVQYALDTTNDRTAEFNNWHFFLSNNTSYFNGPMIGVNGTDTIRGHWGCNSDYSKLSILLNDPYTPASFAFLNRDWRFTSKAFPTMKLAPWGTTDPKTLYMYRH